MVFLVIIIIIIIIRFFRQVFSECTEAIVTKKSAKKIRKQVRGCLQNLYQSVAIHLKYVLLVLL